jgi:hypothetical protein
MRYQVNVLSETRAKRVLLLGGNQKGKRRPTHTLQQVSMAVDQMLELSANYTPEKMQGIGSRRSFQGALKRADNTQGDRMVEARLLRREAQKRRTDPTEDEWGKKELEFTSKRSRHESKLHEIGQVTEAQKCEAVINEVAFAGQKSRATNYWSNLQVGDAKSPSHFNFWPSFSQSMPLLYYMGRRFFVISTNKNGEKHHISMSRAVTYLRFGRDALFRPRKVKDSDRPYVLKNGALKWYRGALKRIR